MIQQNSRFNEITRTEFKEGNIDRERMKELLKELEIEGENIKGFINRLIENGVISESKFMKIVGNVNSSKYKLMVMAQNLLKYMKKQ